MLVTYTFLDFCFRPLRKRCIPVMKRKTLWKAWSPILCGDSPAATFSFPLLPSGSWNKLTWKVNQRIFKDPPASPWRFCLSSLSLLQTLVGECPWATFSHFIFWMLIAFCGLLRLGGSLLDLCGKTMGFPKPKERRVTSLR